MWYRVTADLLFVLHLAFICFVVAGGLLALRRAWIACVHLPAVVWTAALEFQGWICPLTPLEQAMRRAAGQTGYCGSYIEHYLLPIIYPTGLTRDVQLVLGALVVAINLAIYAIFLFRMWQQPPGRNFPR